MRVVHLPVYYDNAYQRLLMDAQRRLGVETVDGGGGGNFFRTALLRWKADILHFHWLHPYMIRPSAAGTVVRSLRLLVELSLLKMFGQRIVWTVHNLKNHDNRHVRLERWFTKRFVRLASAIIAHSEMARRQAAAAFNIRDDERIHIVPHGNYIDCYPNELSSAAAREQLGIDPARILFLFFGRIEPYKEVPHLVREFKTVPGDVQLLIAGRIADAETAASIRTEIGGAENVVFHPGFVAEDRIQLYMNACDAVILPYRDVSTSGAAMLAMSFGRACIAAKLPGMLELLDDDGAFLYEPNQPGALVQAIRAAVASKGDLPKMGTRNRAKISSNGWDLIARLTVEIYQGVS